MIHLSKARVRYAETDCSAVAYHSNYLYWFEIGRTEMMRDAGFPYGRFERDRGLLLTVVEAHLEYRMSARYDDVIRIESELDDFKRVQFTVRHRLLNDATERELATGYVRLACVTREGKVRAVPDDVRRALEPYVLVRPADAGPGNDRRRGRV